MTSPIANINHQSAGTTNILRDDGFAVSEHDIDAIARANSSGRQPVVFMHGLWLLPSSWDRWISLFEEAGYVALMPAWPDNAYRSDAPLPKSGVFENFSISQIADHFCEILIGLNMKPAIIGHSFGGLLAQMLAGRGCSAVTVAVDPAPVRSVSALPLAGLQPAWPDMWASTSHNRSIPLTFDQFRDNFANRKSLDVARKLFSEFAVQASRSALFQESGNLNPWSEANVNTENSDRGPMLIISGELYAVPWSIASASFLRQKENAGVTELVEIENRGHALTIDSQWREVAEVALSFVTRFTPAMLVNG